MRKTTLLLLVLWLIFAPPAFATDLVRVYYAGPTSGVLQALRLDQSLQLVDTPAQADVMVVDNATPDAAALRARAEQGAGLVLFVGPGQTAAWLSAALGDPVSVEQRSEALSVDAAEGATDPLATGVVWTSAPQVRERAVLSGTALKPLVAGFDDHSLVLGSKALGQGQVLAFTPFLDGANPQIQEWAYFNYLVHAMVHRAAGRTPEAFADYPGAPVPHRPEQVVLILILAGLLVGSGVAFFLVRRYSLAHPETLDALVVDRSEFEQREAGTGWEEIGFHRPLAGFFVSLFLGMILFVPLIIYQNVLLPVYILPSAQALGLWGRVTQFFNLAWLVFDMGTSVAFIKFLSQYRVTDPRRGVQYGQVFVWWQALSGAVQLALVVALAGTVVPRTIYAIYAWSIVIHTFIQMPGFYQVMRHALTGLQRTDYVQILELSLSVVFPMLAQPAMVTIMVIWGRVHPVFGPAMGGLLGMGLAAYACEALTFCVGLWLYRRLGYNARVYFLAHFDWPVIKDAFRFGVFEMLSSAVVAVGGSFEILVTGTYLVNYAEVWANWTVAQNFVAGFQVIGFLYNNLMPSISEAVSHGRRMLGQYYSAQAYKWGGLLSAMLGAGFLATADRFILGASGPEFVRAAAYSVPLLIWGAVQYPAWVGDNVQRGANKPWMMVVTTGLEQTIRIGLALALLRQLQITALIVAYLVAIMVKNTVAYVLNHRLCFPQRFYVWQSLVAPLLAGAAHYAVLRLLGNLIWRGPGDLLSSFLLFFIAILPSYPMFAFFYGFFGGWDPDTLAEVKQAAQLSALVRPLALLFWAASDLGARLSPLHGRFPISIRAAAVAEARSLEQERVAI
jgi:O-antigen/teichoic acid export membrane protein